MAAALAPAAAAAAARKLGGAHYHGTATFRISPVFGKPPVAPPVEATTKDTLTTTTDLWLDAEGRFRLTETNDQDGGRDIGFSGREIAVALRYGKLVRRATQEPEPTRMLEEALGAPGAAWEIVGRFASVATVPGKPGSYRLSKSGSPLVPPEPAGSATPGRRWRESITVEALSGEVELDATTRALVGFALNARFSARRDSPGMALPVAGGIDIALRADGIGHAEPVTLPASAVELPPRQRPVLEERALLSSTPGSGKDRR